MKSKAEAEGRVPNVGKTTVKCKTCQKTGHNSRTCEVKVFHALSRLIKCLLSL